jgi:hypothetical protein
MKKLLVLAMVSLILFLAAGPASAWYGHGYHPGGRSHFGFFIGPPVFFAPPLPVYPRYYYPQEYYDPGYRVWVPGYWDYRGTPHGRERVWFPGHWEWQYDR